MAKTIALYATRLDAQRLCRSVEAEQQLKYVAFGNHDRSQPVFFLRAEDIPDFGVATQDDHVGESLYLVMPRSAPIRVERVRLNDGTKVCFVGPYLNSDSVSFRPAGNCGENAVIQGSLASSGTTPAAMRLFRLFRKHLQHQFVKVKNTYVGKDALDLFQTGGRLTQSTKLLCEWDFVPAFD